MTSKTKDFFKSLIIFDNLTKIFNLYVLILAIIALLATIGTFSVRIRPEFKVLPPIYSFNIKQLAEISNKKNYKVIINTIPTLNRSFNGNDRASLRTYGWDIAKKEEIKYLLPYETLDSNSFGWSSNTKDNLWYRLGIEHSTPDSVNYSINNSNNRTDHQKLIALDLLFAETLTKDPALTEQDTNIKGTFSSGIDTFGINPLIEIKNYKSNFPNVAEYEKFIMDFTYSCTKVYSVVTIENNYNAPIENINVYINDALNNGKLEIIGWTKGASNIEVKSNGVNKLLTLDKLDPKKSVEIVFRGFKYIRENEISTQVSSITGFNICIIYIILSLTFLFVLLIYFFQWKIILKNKNHNL